MKTSARTQKFVRGVRAAAPPALAKEAVSSWFNIATLSAWMLGFGALPASAQPAVDGTLDAAYGAALAVQSVQTQFGDANPPGNLGGSELDAAYATIVNGRLYLMLTGNHEPNFNKLEVFIDSKPGGENVLTGTPQYDFLNGSTWISQNMINLTFDAGFAADYHLFSRWASGSSPYVADFVNRQGGGSAQVPGSTGSTPNAVGLQASGVISAGNVGPNASGTALSQNIQFAINDNNTGGVTGGTGAANVAAAMAVTTGMEFSIALADLGNPPPGATIRIAAMIDNGDHNYLSNQLLDGLAAPQGNLGGDGAGNFTGTLSGVNLTSFAGLQYFVIIVPSTNQPPVAVCTNITVAAGTNCLGIGSVDGGSYDPDGTNDTITVTQTPPGPYPVGTNNVTLCVTDSHGASNCCNAVVVVQDKTPPVIHCPPDIIVTNEPGQCSAVVNYTVTASDGCGGCTLLSQDFNTSPGGFMVVPPPSFPQWMYDPQAGSWLVPGIAAVSDGNFVGSILQSPPIPVTCAGPGQLTLVHRFSVPQGPWGGGDVQVSVGGGPFVSVSPVDANFNVSSPTLSGVTSLNPPLPPFVTNSADLGDLDPGDVVVIRFVYGGAEGLNVSSELISAPVLSGWEITSVALAVGGGNGSVTLVCDPPSGSAFPAGTNRVCCTATDAAGNTNTCCFEVVVEDREAPRGQCVPGVNPSGKKIPVAGKNPSSGQNPDGFYQLLSRDNCDDNPEIYIADTGSLFVAGPFTNGTVVKITQSPGRTPSQDSAPPPIAAHLHLKGDGMLYVVDSNGNASEAVLCLGAAPTKIIS